METPRDAAVPLQGSAACLEGIAARLDELNATLRRLEDIIAAHAPGTAIALAADAVMMASGAPARLTADLLVAAYKMVPEQAPPRPAPFLAPVG